MSRFNGLFKQMCMCAAAAIAFTAGCADSSSDNWNNMFSRSDDRRVEPSANDAPPANRPEPGATAAKPETARNDYVQPEPTDSTDATDRGNPSAIEQYAANMNPPSGGGARIQTNQSAADTGNRQNPSATMGASSSANGSASDEWAISQPSPVRTATDRPADTGFSQNTPPPAATTSRQPAPNNTMFITSGNSSNASSASNPGGGSLPTVEDRAAQPVNATPIDSTPRANSDVSNGAPVIDGVTARPAETSSSDAGRSSRIDSAIRNDPSIAPPPVDDSAARRQREIAAQEAKVAADPTNVEEQFNLRTMYLSDGRDTDALMPIRGVTPDVEEIMLAQLRSLQAARSGSARDPATWANRQLEATRALQEKLRAKADLQVPKVELCTEIRQFGVYTPFPSSDFKAGVPNDVLIYVEVDNFESRKLAGDEYRTLLGAQLSLLSKDGKVLVSLDEPNIEDVSRGVRRDFFLAFGPITIPGNLPVGEYVVDVSIEDKLAGKTNNNKTSLRLVP